MPFSDISDFIYPKQRPHLYVEFDACFLHQRKSHILNPAGYCSRSPVYHQKVPKLIMAKKRQKTGLAQGIARQTSFQVKINTNLQVQEDSIESDSFMWGKNDKHMQWQQSYSIYSVCEYFNATNMQLVEQNCQTLKHKKHEKIL